MKPNFSNNPNPAVMQFSRISFAVMVALGVVATPTSVDAGPGSVKDPISGVTIPTYYANSPQLRKFVDTLPGLTPAGTNTFANGTAGQYIPVAVPDITTYPGSNYFIIGVVEHSQRMHSDLQKATMLRSYVQLVPKTSERPAGFVMPTTAKPLFYPDANGAPSLTPIYWPNTFDAAGNPEQVIGWDNPHYLGPTIITEKGTPVRIKFMNFLPKGRGTATARNGDLFIPVDESLPGAGSTPTVGENFPQNRVAIHLHGGDSPWINDGTPHQWVAAAGDLTPYKKGDRVVNVPDMPDPGEGGVNVYYPNDQSSRLMWYHDHAFGVTRQNAYAGEAAAYLVTDATEDALLAAAAIPSMPMLPLILQDKGFVPADIAIQDSLWDQTHWGKPGDLWYPHVYEQAVIQNPVSTGLIDNPAGRWLYGPTGIPGAVGAAFVAPRLSLPTGGYGQVSTTPEAYMDTAMVNGVAYPTVTVEPKAYRTRFLNGANDRYFNLSLWVADGTVPALADGRTNTEVKMVPELIPSTTIVAAANGGAGYVNPKVTIIDQGGYGSGAVATATVVAGVITAINVDPTSPGSGYVNPQVQIVDAAATTPAVITLTTVAGRPGGIPDPLNAGPAIIQFGNETGLLPNPVVYKATPMNMFFDTGALAWVETKGGFYLANAERADAVIDFSQYAGQTLILYNDSAAPVPGGDDRYDYFTGNTDQTAFGGAATTPVGFGPNTRTVMQIKVAATQAGGAAPAAVYDAAGNGGLLATVLPTAYAAKADAHINLNVVADGKPMVDATGKPVTLAAWDAAQKLADPTYTGLKLKTIEGGFDPNFGRLIANFGTELPTSPAGVATPLSYIDTATDIVEDGKVQYWYIKNNDADNHPIHFHLFNVQVIARVVDTVAGTLVNPTPDEAGWKETVQNWPGMVQTAQLSQGVIVALKPKTPALPFGLPNSVRLMDPTSLQGDNANASLYPGSGVMANGTTVPYAFSQFDLVSGALVTGGVSNQIQDYGWEYVFHCHILGHEENDLMRPLKFKPLTAQALPAAPTLNSVTNGVVAWTDATPATVLTTKGNPANEIGFRVEQAPVINGVTGAFTAATAIGGVTPFVKIPDIVNLNNNLLANQPQKINALANATSMNTVVTGLTANTDYAYQVVAVNQLGEAKSAPITVGQAPAPVTGLSASLITATGLNLTWTDNATNETGFDVQYSTSADNGVSWSTWTSYPAVAANLVGGVVTYPVTGLTPATMYRFQVGATKTGFVTQYTAPVTATTLVQLLAPTWVSQVASIDPMTNLSQVLLTWADTSGGETAYSVERCAGTATTCAVATANWTVLSNTLAANSVTYTDTTAASGVTYVYRVKALSTVAGVTTPGPVSLLAQVTGAVMVAPPTALTATSPTGAGVTLSWTDSSTNETSFQVDRANNVPGVLPVFAPVGLPVTRTTALGTATGGTVTTTDATAVQGASYIYQVRAVKTVAATATAAATVSSSVPSNQAGITLILPAPTTLTAVQAGTTVTLNWKDMSATETAFEVLRTDTVTGLSVVLPQAVASTTPGTVVSTAAQTTAVNRAVTFSDTTATVGVPYTYQVRAVNAPVAAVGAVVVPPTYSAYSAAVSATVALAAPTGLTTALPAAPATTGVVLNWMDNATIETAYRIDRAIVTPDAAGNVPAATVFTPVATVNAAAVRANAATATGAAAYIDATATPATLAAGTTYAYQVVAVYTKVAVAAVGTTTPAIAGYTVNSAPSNAAHTVAAVALTGAPTALTALTTSGTSVVLSWIDNTAAETAYQVTRTDYTNPAAPVSIVKALAIVKGTGTKGTYTDTTAVVGTSYTYTVTAVTPTANLSASITAGLTLNAPTAATATLVATGIQIGWIDQSNNETGFQISRVVIDPLTGLPATTIDPVTQLPIPVAPVLIPVTSTAAQKIAVGTLLTKIDTTAVPGVIYSYSVASVSGAKVSTAVATTPVTITAAIAPPSTPNAVITTANRITVTWTDLSTNETGFVIERAINGVWGATPLATITSTKTGINTAMSYLDNLAAPVVQGTYQYRVTAVNQTGVAPAVVTNGFSAAVSSNIVNLAVPAAPTALTATATVGVPGVVTLTWADNSTNETGFTVQYATNATFTTGLVTVPVPGANATASVNYTLNGLTTGTKLFFRVQATSAAGVSTWASTVATVTIP